MRDGTEQKTVEDFVGLGDDDVLVCARCGSHQIHAEKRGYNVWAGVFGMSKIVMTCLKCGYQFKPGAHPPLSGRDFAVMAMIAFVLWFFFGANWG